MSPISLHCTNDAIVPHIVTRPIISWIRDADVRCEAAMRAAGAVNRDAID